MKQILLSLLLLCSLGVYAQDVVVTRQRKQQTTTKPKQNGSQKKQSKATTKTSVIESDPSGYANGHGYVDLGLPSGTFWATCNIGANNPEQYGDYYAWGEISTKKSYHENNSKWHNVSKKDLQSMNVINNNGKLTSQYDVANQKWGVHWHIPSVDQFRELLENTNKTWTKINGRGGFLFKSKINGNSLFLPAAGDKYYGTLRYSGERGNYWTSESSDKSAVHCYFHSGDAYPDLVLYCYYGQPIRPVYQNKR